jgi:transposase InsO family protein
MPARPWQRIAADLMEFKKVQYLVVVDYYSRYIELSKLENTSSASIINHLKSIMARHGVPEALVSDNGPQFSSKEFVLFAKDYGFSHVTSSPGHASGNGEVERAVRTVKELLYAAQYPYSAHH